MLGFISLEGTGAMDRFLLQLAAVLEADGLRLAGAVQENTEAGPETKAHMDLVVFPARNRIRISQSLGREATGCRLDPDGLAQAIVAVETHLRGQDADLLIVNKFGAQEADGQGFRTAIALGIEADIPTLVGVKPANRAAFEVFTGGLAVELAADAGAIQSWLREAHSG